MAPGQFLTTTADPNKLGMPGAAAAQRGAAVQAEGLRWFGHLLQSQRATEQAANENEFETSVRQGFANIDATTPEDYAPVGSPLGTTRGSPGAYMSATNRQRNHVTALRDTAQKQAMAIVDPVVRRRFLTAASKRISSVTPEINSKIQAQFRDYSQATFARRRGQALNNIVSVPPGGVRNNMIEDFIGTIVEEGRQGFWTEKQITAAIVKAHSDIDLTQARRDLADEKSYEGKIKILKRLDTGKYEKEHPDAGQPAYPNLDIKDRGVLAGRAITQADTAAAAAVRAEALRVRLEDKAAKDAREKREQTIGEQIDAARVAAMTDTRDSNGNLVDSDGVPVTQWSVAEILSINNRELDGDARQRLLQRLQGEDLIVNDGAHLELTDAIYDAFTERELDDVEAKIRDWHNRNIIGFKSRDHLTDQLEKARGKTPGFEEQKRYRGYLRGLMQRIGVEAFGALFAGLAPAEDPKISASRAEMFFDERLRLGDRPAAAFHAAASAYVNFGKRSSVAESFLITMPPSLQKILKFDPANPEVEYDIETLTTADTAAAWDEWVRLSEGGLQEIPGALDLEKVKEVRRKGQLSEEDVRGLGLSERDRITFRDLYASENALEMITGWVTKPGPVSESDTAAPIPDPVLPALTDDDPVLPALTVDDNAFERLLKKLFEGAKSLGSPSTVRD